MKKYIGFLISITGTACALFDYDRAVGAAQNEQWAIAGEKFKSLVTAHPDRPDVLYDAGVVAFKNEDFEQAKALFETAAQHETAPRVLKEQAYFNKANTHVKQEQLKEALSCYDQVLMLNSENEQAKHNADVVKKMLEQQQQKQQQQDKQDKQDQKDGQQNKDQSKQSNKDQQDDDRDEKQNQSQKDSQGGQDSPSQDTSEASEKNEQKQDQQQKGDDKSLDQQGDQKDDERNRPQEQERKPQRQQQRRRRNEPEKNPQKDKQSEQQEKDDHNASLEKEKHQAEQQAQEQNMQLEEKEQGLGKEGVAPIQLDPALERVLARREDRDAQLNKQVIKALVGQTAGQHGQNW